MRDEQGFRKFAAERVGALRRQALLLTGSAAEAAALTDDALADTARRWDSLPPGGAEEHARRALVTGAVRRRAARTRRRGLVGLVAPAAAEPHRAYQRSGRGLVPAGRSGPGSSGPGSSGPGSSAPGSSGSVVSGPGGSGSAVSGSPGPGSGRVASGPADGVTTDVAAAWRALGALPPRRRAVLVLRYDEGLEDAAVGRRLGLGAAEVAAEGEAGLGALRSLLRLRGAPEELVPAALAAAESLTAESLSPARPAGMPAARSAPETTAAAGATGTAPGTGTTPGTGTAPMTGTIPATGTAPAAGIKAASTTPASTTARRTTAPSTTAPGSTAPNTAVPSGTAASTRPTRPNRSTRGSRTPAGRNGPSTRPAGGTDRTKGTAAPVGGTARPAAGTAPAATQPPTTIPPGLTPTATGTRTGTRTTTDPAANDPAATALARAAQGRRRRGILTAVGAVAVLAVAAAVIVPLADRDDPAAGGEVPAATPAGPGLLDWPARGPLVGDTDLLRSALTAWRAGVPAGQAPTGAAVLYAGSPDGTPVVLLQGRDPAGLGWVAEVRTAGAPALVRAEPIGRVAPLLILSVGDTGRVRVLAPADARREGGLLTRPAGVTGDAALRPLALDADGLSDPLDAGRTGTPVVVVRGTGVDSIVAGSGTVLAGRLNPVSGDVEVGSARLGFGRSTDVRADWYTDGALVAGVLGGAVTVAALGPDLTGSVGGKQAHARTYEVQHAGDTWISSVVRIGGVSCVDSSKLGTVTPGADVPVVVRRCAPAGSAAGMLHVLAGRQVASVRITLGAGAKGQRPVQLTVNRRTAGVQDAGDGFTVLIPLPALPTGAAQVQALDAAGRAVALIPLRPYRGPRA